MVVFICSGSLSNGPGTTTQGRCRPGIGDVQITQLTTHHIQWVIHCSSVSYEQNIKAAARLIQRSACSGDHVQTNINVICTLAAYGHNTHIGTHVYAHIWGFSPGFHEVIILHSLATYYFTCDVISKIADFGPHVADKRLGISKTIKITEK